MLVRCLTNCLCVVIFVSITELLLYRPIVRLIEPIIMRRLSRLYCISEVGSKKRHKCRPTVADDATDAEQFIGNNRSVPEDLSGYHGSYIGQY